MIYLKDKQSEPQPSVSDRLLFKLADYCNYSQQGECARQGWTLTVGPVILGGGSSSCQQTAVSGVAVWYVMYLLYLKETK